MGDAYLIEALKGSHENPKEDRLSQIFSASFNHSEIFRQRVGEFFKCESLRNAIARTQRPYPAGKARARIDVVIESQYETPLVVVENKLEAGFAPGQLKKYSRINAIKKCRKFCFVKYYQAKKDVEHGWHIRYWGDFYVHLQLRDDDDFITKNFLAILKEYKMTKSHKLTESELKTLAKAFHRIRYTDEPWAMFSGSIASTLGTLKEILEDTFRSAVEREVITSIVGRVRPTMHIGGWWQGEKKRGKQLLLFGCDASTKKPHRKVKGIGVALLLYDKPEKYDLAAYVTGLDGWWKDWRYPKKEVDCLAFAAGAIKFWTSKLK